MGFMDFTPETLEGGKMIVTGELDRLQLEEFVRRLSLGVEGVLRNSGAAPPAELLSSSAAAVPPPIRSKPRSNPPQPRSGSTPQQILLEKLSQGLRSQSSAAAGPSHAAPSHSTQQGASSSTYQEIFRTTPMDHDMNAVGGLAYAPMLRELPGGDGHGGWLISSSKNMLNLWECTSGAGDPALQMMHSQMTEYQAADMAVDKDSLLLLAASRETSRSQPECLSLHSLNALDGMFVPKGKLPLPPRQSAPPVPPQHPPQHPQALQVQSLQSIGGPLRACAAASYKQTITVYPTDKGVAATPKITWEAHSAFVTRLHCSNYSLDLFSAAVDGTVSRWNMKARPKGVPDARYQGLTREITGLQQISSRHLLAASMEGKLALWDVARPDQPLQYVETPDGHGITKLAASPEDQIAAFATAGNKIYTMSLQLEPARDFLRPSQVVVKGRMDPVKSLVWNSRTRCLMAAVGSSVVVFKSPKRLA